MIRRVNLSNPMARDFLVRITTTPLRLNVNRGSPKKILTVAYECHSTLVVHSSVS